MITCYSFINALAFNFDARPNSLALQACELHQSKISACIRYFAIIYLKRLHTYYTLIAFDERVTFWLQLVEALPCACAYVALFACRLGYNHYAIAQHAMQQTHTHKAVTGRLKEKSYSHVEGNQSIYSC